MFSQKSWAVAARMWGFPAARLMLPDFGKPGADEYTHRKHRTSVAFAWWSIICAMCVKLSAATHIFAEGAVWGGREEQKRCRVHKTYEKIQNSASEANFHCKTWTFRGMPSWAPFQHSPAAKCHRSCFGLILHVPWNRFEVVAKSRGTPRSVRAKIFRLSEWKENENWHKAAHKDHRDKRAKPSFQFASVLRLVSPKINGRENVGTRRARRKHKETKSNLLAGVSIVVQTNFPAKIFNSHLRQSPRNLCLPARCLLSCLFSLGAPLADN